MATISRFRLNKAGPDIDRALRGLVTQAYRRVSVYRRLLDAAGVSPREIGTVRDLPKLPVLAKETLARPARPADVLRRGVDPARCTRVGTSGSTGLPLNIFMSQAEATYRRVLIWRAWNRVTRLAIPLTIADLCWDVGGESPFDSRRYGPVTVHRIAMALPAGEQAALVRRFRPQVVVSNPTTLEILATEGGAFGCRPRLVACRGEILGAEARRILETAFDTRVADFYNAEEIGSIAWECPVDPTVLHVNTDGCVVEIVDDAGRPVPAGVEGRIIATNLYNETMPFIRYDLGDRGALSPEDGVCDCGSRAPRLRALEGRDDDFVYLPDGRRLSPRFLATTVNRAFSTFSPLGAFDRHFRRFRVTQDRLDHVLVEIVPEPGPHLDFATVIGRELAKLHPDFRCTIEIVDRLDLGPSGKYRKVVSTIAPRKRPS